jgi:hypothetical protein
MKHNKSNPLIGTPPKSPAIEMLTRQAQELVTEYKQSQIDYALEALTETVNELDELVLHLQARLHYVMCPAHPEDRPVHAYNEDFSPLTVKIVQHTVRLSDVKDNIHKILSHLAL